MFWCQFDKYMFRIHTFATPFSYLNVVFLHMVHSAIGFCIFLVNTTQIKSKVVTGIFAQNATQGNKLLCSLFISWIWFHNIRRLRRVRTIVETISTDGTNKRIKRQYRQSYGCYLALHIPLPGVWWTVIIVHYGWRHMLFRKSDVHGRMCV